MRAKIISLTGIEFDGEAKSFTAMTEVGEVTVLDHHRPYISTLVPCTARLMDEQSQERTIAVRGGLLHVDDRNQLIVLVD